MSRNRFLKLAAGIAGGALAADVLFDLAPWLNETASAASMRRVFARGSITTAPIREIVRYATLAPSGHNAQPWIFTVDGSKIRISPDATRTLPSVDPNDRELWISLGCALENLTISSRMSGFEPEVTYPEREEGILVNLLPRAPQEIAEFPAISTRQNTRSEYDGRKLTSEVKRQAMSITLEHRISVQMIDSKAQLEQMLEFSTMGNATQLNDDDFKDELLRWIRFNKREAMGSSDGLYTACMGRPQVPRWVGRQFMQRSSPIEQSDLDARWIRSSSAAIVIASSSDTQADWVRTGQVYQRLALRLTTLGMKSALLNQGLEVPTLRSQIQSALGFGDSLPQLFLRIGYADAMPYSLRRPVDEVIIWN